MKGGGYQKGFINGCGVWHLHHSCQCHQFPPINLHNCQFGDDSMSVFFPNLEILFFFRQIAILLTGNSNQKTRLSKMTIVSSSTNQERKDYFVISVWSIGFLKGSRNYLSYLENFTFLKTQNHYQVRRSCAVFLQHILAYLLNWAKSTGFAWCLGQPIWENCLTSSKSPRLLGCSFSWYYLYWEFWTVTKMLSIRAVVRGGGQWAPFVGI